VSSKVLGCPLVRITDERLKIHTYVPAGIRAGPAGAGPDLPHVPDLRKRVEVSLASQALTAYEGDKPVYKSVSTGRRWMETPVGDFRIERKYPPGTWATAGLLLT
jgi:lipoprotein-anchoring transpeptidase ErfK/SrfK